MCYLHLNPVVCHVNDNTHSALLYNNAASALVSNNCFEVAGKKAWKALVNRCAPQRRAMPTNTRICTINQNNHIYKLSNTFSARHVSMQENCIWNVAMCYAAANAAAVPVCTFFSFFFLSYFLQEQEWGIIGSASVEGCCGISEVRGELPVATTAVRGTFFF